MNELRRAASLLDDALRSIRLSPFAEAVQGLDRVVRDVASATGKQARLEIEGASVELDRAILRALRQPLIHLVRNAVHHGVETPEERRAAGKAPAATIRVAAELRGGGVVVRVADDGRGVDMERLRRLAAARGLRELAGGDPLQLLFEPGFSTADEVGPVAGRGVGLDAVRTAAEAVGGSAALTSTAGEGTEVRLSLPLTRSVVSALLVRAGGQTLALPVHAVNRVLSVRARDVVTVSGAPAIPLGERTVPLRALSSVLGLPSLRVATAAFPAVLLNGDTPVAFAVDELLGERELVAEGLGPRLEGATAVLGVAPLPRAGVVLLLAPGVLVRESLDTSADGGLAEFEPRQAPKVGRVLLAEDSPTTRALERMILEAADYEVLEAPDGLTAWELLELHGADLVLTDVDMPSMNGVELCRRIRASARFRQLPVILLTSLADEQDRRRGLEAGADAYQLKRDFEQGGLLDLVRSLL